MSRFLDTFRVRLSNLNNRTLCCSRQVNIALGRQTIKFCIHEGSPHIILSYIRLVLAKTRQLKAPLLFLVVPFVVLFYSPYESNVLTLFTRARRRRVIKWAPFVFFSRSFGSTSCMVHDYVPTIYKASELEQVATSDLERSYDL